VYLQAFRFLNLGFWEKFPIPFRSVAGHGLLVVRRSNEMGGGYRGR
jgi:hypothetical protein